MKQIQEIQKDIDELVENPVSLYGEELGVAKLVREGMKFRIFSKKVSSGQKADLVDLNIVVEDEAIEGYRYLKGRTYIPHFALKDVYWILDKKVYNIHHGSQMGIDQSYVKEGKHIEGLGARIDKQSPEEHGLSLVKFLRQFSASQYPLVLA
jgi:hypothetical protein